MLFWLSCSQYGFWHITFGLYSLYYYVTKFYNTLERWVEKWICVYVMIYVLVTYCMSVCVEARGYFEVSFFNRSPPFYVLRQDWSLNQKFTKWLGWLANKFQESACLCCTTHLLPSVGLHTAPTTPVFWVSEFRSSCPHSRQLLRLNHLPQSPKWNKWGARSPEE